MYASFLQRLKAFLIDYLVIFLYLIGLFLIQLFFFPSLKQLFTGSLIVAQLSGFLFVTLPVSLYFIICDSHIGKQSIGKRKMGIKVVAIDGNSPSLFRSIMRTMIKFLPWELSHYLVYRLVNLGDHKMPLFYYIVGSMIYIFIFAYIFTAIFTSRKQSLYDIVTKTVVVKINDD